MMAVLWLCLSVFAGWRIISFSGDLRAWINRMGSLATATPFCLAPWTLLLLRLALAVPVGLLAVTWLTYGLAAFFRYILPSVWQPLLPANLLVLCILAAWACITAILKRQQLWSAWPGRMRDLQQRRSHFVLGTILIWLLFASWLMFRTFQQNGPFIQAGYSVFSDFAPHTAIVSSFAKGLNWPTQYPHFANDGISYHFMFFFLCGNLEFLGLPLVWAINLPSILTFVSFCMLLGFLAVRLTGRSATFLLAPLMLFLRSSAAFFTNLAETANSGTTSRLDWKTIIDRIWHQTTFSGNMPNDSWGLWGVNVYANQRHLLSGLSLLLIVLMLVLPDLQTGLRAGWKSWFRPEGWLPRNVTDWKRYGTALLICVLMPYWHGSAMVALLLVLFPLAFFTRNRLALLFLALASFGSALLQSWFFSGEATRVVQPSFLFGFIAADRSAGGILLYLMHVTGLALPLLVFAFWQRGRRRKVLILAFMMPLFFAFTVSLTPDVTVNHKYIIIALALANIYLADLLARLWQKKQDLTRTDNSRLDGRSRTFVPLWLLRRATAVLLVFVLMVTGLHEIRILNNVNQNAVSLDSRSPLVSWIANKTDPQAVFVTAPYHYNTFFLTGRSIWFGHSYYAWSAGHDTGSRFTMLQSLLAAPDEDPEEIRKMAQEENLHYLLIDDTLRNHPDLDVNETFFHNHFQLAAAFPEQENTLIYDLRQMP